jgi:hypothetical protein
MLFEGHSGVKPAWTGEKNCYRIGMWWSSLLNRKNS